MNVYQRLQKARVELQKQPLKESGKNTFANYSYLELGDFLPQINAICSEVGLCGCVSFGKEEASLTIVNTDKPEETVVFASPMSTAELKGCHQIQNLGAVQSYLRRYLWLAAFEIVEHDALDATTGKKEQTPPREPPKISDSQRKKLFAAMGEGAHPEAHKKHMETESDALKAHFKVASSSDILASQFNDVLKWVAERKAAREAQGTGY